MIRSTQRRPYVLLAGFSVLSAGCALVAGLNQFDGYVDSTDAGSSDDVAPLPDVAAMPEASGGGPESSPPDVADVVTPPGIDGGNLIKNPSCEDGTLYWSTLAGSPIESSTAYALTGEEHSCHAYDRTHEAMSPQLPSYDGPLQDVTAAIVPGHEYAFSVWTLWAPPLSDASVPAEASSDAPAEAATESGSSDPDAGNDGDAGDGGDGGIEQQNVDVTIKVDCDGTDSYQRIATATNLPEATWVQASNSGFIVMASGCKSVSMQLYVEGPDVGLDLYTADGTLTFLQ